ncbi:MAG: twin-arginine translocation signal domain-containing protein, partial [Xanthomonadales bacterium]|nr:twin-arginine translocation signal domain-containing protein [Xanthomonadales bacterium]
MSNGGRDARKRLQRRDFIRLTTAAGAALPLTGFRPLGPRGSPPATTPEPGDVVDPTQTVFETWQEPWTWRPELWPGDALDLSVVRGQNPGPPMSSGMETSSLFSFNGISPGPTVRMRGDGELKVHLRNTLGLNAAEVPVGPCPDLFEITPAMRLDLCARANRQLGTELDDEGDCV